MASCGSREKFYLLMMAYESLLDWCLFPSFQNTFRFLFFFFQLNLEIYIKIHVCDLKQ